MEHVWASNGFSFANPRHNASMGGERIFINAVKGSFTSMQMTLVDAKRGEQPLRVLFDVMPDPSKPQKFAESDPNEKKLHLFIANEGMLQFWDSFDERVKQGVRENRDTWVGAIDMETSTEAIIRKWYKPMVKRQGPKKPTESVEDYNKRKDLPPTLRLKVRLADNAEKKVTATVCYQNRGKNAKGQDMLIKIPVANIKKGWLATPVISVAGIWVADGKISVTLAASVVQVSAPPPKQQHQFENSVVMTEDEIMATEQESQRPQSYSAPPQVDGFTFGGGGGGDSGSSVFSQATINAVKLAQEKSTARYDPAPRAPITIGGRSMDLLDGQEPFRG